MGIYSEYINRNMSSQNVTEERKIQLKKISELRGGRDIFVYAADLNKAPVAPISIVYEDLVSFSDVLGDLKGKAIDIILETPGGYAEVAEDMVNLLRGKYQDIAFIVPGVAKSAGTIMVMSGDEILMEPASSLGPIDAQLSWQGKVFSADALLMGLEKIKEEVNKTGKLNHAFIPILQSISPGEIQHAENALGFAKKLVTDWLADFKFKTWMKHSSDGRPVTPQDRKDRAAEIATKLCDHGKWLTHSKSIKISDLEAMRLRIADYSKNKPLHEAIRRYFILLNMTFESQVYKLFETIHAQIYKYLMAQRGDMIMVPQAIAPGPLISPQSVQVNVTCNKCNRAFKIQCDFQKDVPLVQGCLPYPANDLLECPQCKTSHNLADIRKQLELQTKKEIIRNVAAVGRG